MSESLSRVEQPTRPAHLAGKPDPSSEDIREWARLIVDDDYWPGHSHREDVVVLPRKFVSSLTASLVGAREVIRDALPSLGATRRSYAQEALECACEMLGENPDAWRGTGELALEQEWRARLRVAQEALRDVRVIADAWISDHPNDWGGDVQAACGRIVLEYTERAALGSVGVGEEG